MAFKSQNGSRKSTVSRFESEMAPGCPTAIFFFLSMNPFTCDRLNEPIFFFPLSLQEVIHLLQ